MKYYADNLSENCGDSPIPSILFDTPDQVREFAKARFPGRTIRILYKPYSTERWYDAWAHMRFIYENSH